MTKLKRIVRNISITFLSNNLLKVLSTVLVILIARYLGDVEYGKFSFAISFTGLFLILMDLGTRISIVRDITQNKKEASKMKNIRMSGKKAARRQMCHIILP